MEWICQECTSYNDGSSQCCRSCKTPHPVFEQCECPGCKTRQRAFAGLRCAGCGRLFDEGDFCLHRNDLVVSPDRSGADGAGEGKSSGYTKYVSKRIVRDPSDDPDDETDLEPESGEKNQMLKIVVFLLTVAVTAVVIIGVLLVCYMFLQSLVTIHRI